MQAAPLRSFPGRETEIFPPRSVPVRNPLVYTNAEIFGDPAFLRWLLDFGRSRILPFDPVILKQLEPGSILVGYHSYWVIASGMLLAEQVNPLTPPVGATLDVLTSGLPTKAIETPCLLVSRYGADTWGHWALELLPMVVVAEQCFPGRFTFVVPEKLIPAESDSRYARMVAESLAAYGIGQDRLIPARSDVNLRFGELHVVNGLWSSTAMNRDVCSLMRSKIAGVPATGTGGRNIAILRRGTSGRCVRNVTEIENHLIKHDFEPVRIEQHSFVEQVALFREAASIAAAAGSGLAGLVHAPEKPRVLTVAPIGWRDRYFTNLVQERDGLLADVIGARMWDGEGRIEQAPIEVQPQHVMSGLERLAEAAGNPDADRLIAGEPTAINKGALVRELAFGIGQSGMPTLLDGWAEPEPEHVWTSGRRSRLLIDEVAAADLLLEIEGHGLVCPCLPLRPIAISVNGIEIVRRLFGRDLHILLPLPKLVGGSADTLLIDIQSPITASPAALGIGPDHRPISLALTRVCLSRRVSHA